MSAYDSVMQKQAANFMPLTPLGLLEHTAQVYPERTSIIHGETQYTWAETYARCRSLAHALQKRGIGHHDTVSIMAPNVPAYLEAYYGVPMVGAVLNVLNTRLDAPMLAFMLKHSESRLIFVDRQYSALITDALKLLKDYKLTIVDIDDPVYTGEGQRIGEIEYEELLLEGSPDFKWEWPKDEWDPITLNYTSGTTGDPKGVVYHHRGAFLNAFGNSYVWNMQRHPVYLWTLPAFHASGWCFPWTITALAGTHVCLRKVVAKDIYELIEKHGVTHMCAAPIVVNTMIHCPANEKKSFGRTIEVMTAGSAPPAAVLQAMDALGFNATHVFGATEVYGPSMSCEWKAEWDGLPEAERAKMKARQGVRSPMLEGMIVADPETLEELPWDGETIGECMMRGNIVMSGYLKNPKTTDETLRGGWYHSGDLAVRHPNGYIEVKDRLKDIIISGAENIPTLEIESVLYRHPAVMEAAVVAKPDEKWGETPCAFIELKPGVQATDAEIIAFCRDNMAHYKAPKAVVFGPLDKTPTGKIQKFALRARAKAMAEQEKEAGRKNKAA
jgi:fatty-acyl-CoA synthase